MIINCECGKKKFNIDSELIPAEGRLLKEDKPAGYYNAATITSHSDYYDIIITNKEEFLYIKEGELTLTLN